MTGLIQILIEGVLVGLVYGLVAISFVVIYRASRIINLAQGEVLLFGAYVLWSVTEGARAAGVGLPLPVALGLTALACIAFGVMLERGIFRPLIGQSGFTIFMAGVALLILLRGVTQLLWGAQSRTAPVTPPRGR